MTLTSRQDKRLIPYWKRYSQYQPLLLHTRHLINRLLFISEENSNAYSNAWLCVSKKKECFKFTSNENTTEVEWPARYFIVCIYIIIKIFGFLMITKSSMNRPKLFPNLKDKSQQKFVEKKNWRTKLGIQNGDNCNEVVGVSWKYLLLSWLFSFEVWFALLCFWIVNGT